MDVSNLVDKVAKSVVGVVSKMGGFFGDVGRGFGTAFSIDRGVVATAYHVVQNSDEIALVTPEGEVARAELLVEDPADDIAVLITELKIEPLKLGSALDLKVGEMVVALGYPLAMFDKPTATMGIVSAVGRSLNVQGRIFEFLIQTDAAINPGNSGGPLINTRGEVVGINTAMVAGAQGIGFAIPIDLVKIAYNTVRKYGKFVRPMLGVYVQQLNKAIAAVYNLPTSRGLLVIDVVPDSLAEAIGIRRGDIITSIDGRLVSNVFEMRLALSEAFVEGRRPSVGIIRRGKTLELS